MLYLNAVYNFTYRLSGNAGVAELLTTKVFSKLPGGCQDELGILKMAWESFLKYYGSVEFRGKDRVQQALLYLPPEQRCALVLRDIQGYNYSQIAIVLNKPDSEVRKLVAAGRREFVRENKVG